MKPLTILFDADDVIQNTGERWCSFLNQIYGTNTCYEDVTDWNIAQFFPSLTHEQIFGALTSPDLWRGVEPVPGAQEVLGRFHNEGHKLYMVTATDYRTPKIKFERIFEFFPWLDWEHVIVTSNKQMVNGDILIDDGPHNLVGGDYMKLLFDRPHNHGFDAHANGAVRVRTWEEIQCVVHLYARTDDSLKQAERENQWKLSRGLFTW